ANEQEDYEDPDRFVSPEPPMVVDRPGAVMIDPSRWQPLDLAVAVTQNGIPVGAGVQGYIGPHWRDVEPFAVERPAPGAPYFDLGEGPRFDANIIRSRRGHSLDAELDLTDEQIIDISPASYGNNSLGANDGQGYLQNPFTGEAYEPILVNRGDFGRVMAEYWADGPRSETPPGHWNVIAHQAMESPAFERRIEGAADELGALEYDLKLHLALNGALHDAAIVAWEIKRLYLSARPISLIRTMAGLGQSSEPAAADYDPMGLPLVEGLIERITAESAALGQRHHHLAPYIGELTVRSWRGEPGDPAAELGGIAWIRALEWVPYQRETFVTPAFPGYTSGHSTFSRSAAEVLAAITGTPFFPGGLGQNVLKKDAYLTFEQGPSTDVPLSYATYYDAADQAGQSRLWGGIHIAADDFDGRRTGSEVGKRAFTKAKTFFDGSARP
ncbi:MAG: vanadium-dependent haloperoxidase, partial [Myxococcales bacterium]|nr:vanadium-dependent haloperoxidase [Myxococcales bacterium]